MIQAVSTVRNVSFREKAKTDDVSEQKPNIYKNPYVDSFVRNAKESFPVMFAVSGGWAVYDIISKKSKPLKAISHNLFGFFVPIMVVSSALLSFVENKKTSKNSN